MNIFGISLSTILLFVFAYWLGKRFGWWPSFLPS